MDNTPPAWAADIIARLERIETLLKASRLTNSACETLTRMEVAKILRCKSASGMRLAAKRLGLRPYLHGKYRRGDVENAVASAGLRANKLRP